jgi:heme exporter protein D
MCSYGQEDNQFWAAAQAIGSILAIIAAFIISFFQHQTAMRQVKEQHQYDLKLQENQEKRRKQMIIDTISTVVLGAEGVLTHIISDFQTAVAAGGRIDGHKSQLFDESLRDLERDMSSISIFELPDSSLVKDFFMLRTAIKQCIYNFAGVIKTKQAYDQNIKQNFLPPILAAKTFLGEFHNKLAQYE